MKVKVLVIVSFISQLTISQNTIKKEYPIQFSVIHSVSNHSAESQNNVYIFSFNLLSGKIGSVNGF